jgi:hypothetical protein
MLAWPEEHHPSAVVIVRGFSLIRPSVPNQKRPLLILLVLKNPHAPPPEFAIVEYVQPLFDFRD